MRRRQLGNTGIQVSQVGLGTWPLAGNVGLPGYGAFDEHSAHATVQAALENGIRLFDTADVYGDGIAESLLGRMLRDADDTVVVTKGGLDPETGTFDTDGDRLIDRAEASLERLGRDRIDVLLLHNPEPSHIALDAAFRPLIELQRRGVARWIGVSVREPHDGWLLVDRPEVDVIELPFNLLNASADLGLYARAARNRKGILVREALANGMLHERTLNGVSFATDDFRASLPPALLNEIRVKMTHWSPYLHGGETWADLALRFVLDRPWVSAVLVGARRIEHIEALVRAGEVSHAAAAFHTDNGTQVDMAVKNVKVP